MYRVDLPRPLTLVVALFSTVAPTSVLARELPAANASSEVDPTDVALIGTCVPSMNVLSMPFLFRSSEQLQNALDVPSGTEIPNSLTARAIDGGARPVNSSRDGQVPTGRANRLIEGANNNFASFVTSHHCTSARLHPLSEYAMSGEVQVMPPKCWQSLSDRSIFPDATPRASRLLREKVKHLNEHSRQQAESAGVAMMTDFDRKPLQGAITATYNKARRDSAAADLIDRIRKVE